jgi:ribokinase
MAGDGRSEARGTGRGLVVVVGSVNTDYVMRVERRPHPGETVGGALLEVHGGGKGANQALAAAICGAEVELVARVGADAMGNARLAELNAAGVGTGRVLVTPGWASGVAMITLTPDGENEIIVAPGANGLLVQEDIDKVADLLTAADVLLAQLEVPVATVARSVQIVGARAQVVLNCAPFHPLPEELAGRVDVLVANELEAAALACRSVGGVDDAIEVGDDLRRLGPTAVVVTLGAQGAVVVGPGLAEHVAVPATKVVDTTGAGDAFAGALAARMAAGEPLVGAVEFGVAVGSATTERMGAAATVPAHLRDRRPRPKSDAAR